MVTEIRLFRIYEPQLCNKCNDPQPSHLQQTLTGLNGEKPLPSSRDRLCQNIARITNYPQHQTPFPGYIGAAPTI